MWDPQHLTTLRASTVCYGDSVLYLLYVAVREQVRRKRGGKVHSAPLRHFVSQLCAGVYDFASFFNFVYDLYWNIQQYVTILQWSVCFWSSYISFHGLKLGTFFFVVFSSFQNINMPIAVVARPKAWTVFARSNTDIVDSNPIGVIDVCVCSFCVCVVLLIGIGLATGWSPVQGVLPTGYRNRKTETEAKAQQKGGRA
jgi:hypothetical protein